MVNGSLDSLHLFLWSLSAAFGGFVVGPKDVVFVFYLTAGLQFLATLPLVCLFGSDDIPISENVTGSDLSNLPLNNGNLSNIEYDENSVGEREAMFEPSYDRSLY